MPKPEPPAQNLPSRRSYFPELDGVRAVAITMVLVFHMAQQGIPIPGPVIIGQTGVDLFFVLSGFLITGILLKSRQRDWGEVRTFYVRRTLRIFPLYYATLLGLMLVRQPAALPFWLYVQNLYMAFGVPVAGPNHFWSLGVEEQFYLVWPFLVLFLPRRWLLQVLLGMIAAAVLCRFVLIAHGVDPFTFTLSRADALAAGGMLALLQTNGRLWTFRRALRGVLAGSMALLLLESLLAVRPGLFWVETTKFSLFAAMYASAMGLLLLAETTWLNRMLRAAPLRFVGRVSYGLYVFHPLVFAFVFARLAGQPAVVRAAAGAGASLACALLSWYGFERWFLRLKDRWAPERAKFPASAPAETAA